LTAIRQCVVVLEFDGLAVLGHAELVVSAIVLTREPVVALSFGVLAGRALC
jgi:hypothetical protein